METQFIETDKFAKDGGNEKFELLSSCNGPNPIGTETDMEIHERNCMLEMLNKANERNGVQSNFKILDFDLNGKSKCGFFIKTDAGHADGVIVGSVDEVRAFLDGIDWAETHHREWTAMDARKRKDGEWELFQPEEYRHEYGNGDVVHVPEGKIHHTLPTEAQAIAFASGASHGA